MTNWPWINFEINLQKLPWHSWVKLGECVAKCEQIKTVPLKPEVRNQLHLIYLAKGVQATTAIEGNTLSEEQVKDLVDKKLELPPSKEYLKTEVQNIIDACNEIAVDISSGKFNKISAAWLCQFNKKILQNVPVAEDVQPGQIRTHAVVVGNLYRAPDAKDVSALVEKFCDWMNSSCLRNEQMPVHFAIIKAVAAHLYIAWIHPFGDGNGRVARLLEFAILLGSGIPSPAAHLLSNHYNVTRTEYYRQLDKAGKTNDPTEFFCYAIQGFLDGLEEQLKYIREHIIDVCWREFIYQRFQEVVGKKVMRRRRKLALQISGQKDPINREHLLTLMEKDYRNSERTLSRDLNELEKMKLIIRDGRSYIANKDLILQLLPFST